jgi:AraC-like DNA-binding protein
VLDLVRKQQLARHFRNRRLTLTDVAHLLGFEEPASFSAWYRSHFKTTPSEGRDRLRGTGPADAGTKSPGASGVGAGALRSPPSRKS